MRRLYTISFLLTAFALTSEGEKKENLKREFAKRTKTILEKLKLEDFSKPQKLSEGRHRCNAVFRYEEMKSSVVYDITPIHSGKQKFYKVEVQEILIG